MAENIEPKYMKIMARMFSDMGIKTGTDLSNHVYSDAAFRDALRMMRTHSPEFMSNEYFQKYSLPQTEKISYGPDKNTLYAGRQSEYNENKTPQSGQSSDDGTGDADKKTIVIGETMKRVQDYAKTIDAEVYGAFKYYDKTKAIFGEKLANFIGGVDNALWLIDKMVHKYKIVDLGLDVERATRSPYYLMESVLSYLYKYKDYAEDFMKGAF